MLNYMWVEGRGVQIYDLGQSQRTISGPFLYINQIDPELEARLDQDYVSQLFNNINWESRKKPTTRRNPDRLQLHKQFIIFILSPGFRGRRKHPCSKFTNSSFALDGCTLMCTRNPIHINIYGINWNQSKQVNRSRIRQDRDPQKYQVQGNKYQPKTVKRNLLLSKSQTQLSKKEKKKSKT